MDYEVGAMLAVRLVTDGGFREVSGLNVGQIYRAEKYYDDLVRVVFMDYPWGLYFYVPSEAEIISTWDEYVGSKTPVADDVPTPTAPEQPNVRDGFALVALQGVMQSILAGATVEIPEGGTVNDGIAMTAWSVADAMMRAREVK